MPGARNLSTHYLDLGVLDLEDLDNVTHDTKLSYCLQVFASSVAAG